ncbi:glycine-rich RNA-binding protein 5, mitochondrial isoform X2 [Zerene cesonia]|nr:glycine-rich RNA-binding protein 5, mitochondrial isoform X2 [Zerene cesonia]
MDWRTVLMTLALLYHVDGFSKYGRTCRDIGCLNSEVCVLAEDPCSFGHTSNCGTYPTCKKKSQVEGTHSDPVQPKPKPPQTPTRDFDSAPNYPAPSPPLSSNGHGSNSPYGGNSPYGDSSHYGGSSPYGGNSPYGGSSAGGGGSPYGGNNNPSSHFGGGSPYGDRSPYGGSSPYGSSSNRGGNPPYGGSSSGSLGGFGSNGKSPIDSILNTINSFANGQGGASGGQGSIGNILGNILGNFSKNGGLSSVFNTRPIMENPNYSSYTSNSRSSNAQTYPSGNQPGYQAPNQNKNYGQNYAHRSGATTNKPVSYGWNIG